MNPVIEEKIFHDYLMEIITPWDAEEFEEGNMIDKGLAIFVAPLYFICKITCPVVAENERESWNRPLTIVQGNILKIRVSI